MSGELVTGAAFIGSLAVGYFLGGAVGRARQRALLRRNLQRSLMQYHVSGIKHTGK